MAMAVRAETTETGSVAGAAALTYAARGEFVVDAPLATAVPGSKPAAFGASRAVVVTERQRAEIVLDEHVAAGSLIPAIAGLAASGWETVVLVPGPRLGEAHAALRGLPCLLQQWWWEGDAIRFGGFEVP